MRVIKSGGVVWCGACCACFGVVREREGTGERIRDAIVCACVRTLKLGMLMANCRIVFLRERRRGGTDLQNTTLSCSSRSLHPPTHTLTWRCKLDTHGGSQV